MPESRSTMVATAPPPTLSHGLLALPPELESWRAMTDPTTTPTADPCTDHPQGPATSIDNNPSEPDPLLLRPPPKLKANATHLLAGNLSASDLISPPPSALASLASTPTGSELLSFDFNLEPPPIPMLRTHGETVTSDAQQRMLLHRQSMAIGMGDQDLRPDSELISRLSMLDCSWEVRSSVDPDDTQATRPGPLANPAAGEASQDPDRHHGSHKQLLMTPAPSCSLEAPSRHDGTIAPDDVSLHAAVLELPPPPPPPAPRSSTSSPNVPISPVASLHLTTAFAFDPASALLASAIPLPESPAVDSTGRSSTSDSVFARTFGFESNADPAFIPTPELLPNSSARTSSPVAAIAEAAGTGSPALLAEPISASALASALSLTSSADHLSSNASTIRPNQSAAASQMFLDQTPTQSLTPQPQSRNSLCVAHDAVPVSANDKIGLTLPIERDPEAFDNSLLSEARNTPAVAFPSPPSPATIFGDSVDAPMFLNDSAFSGTILFEPVPRLPELSTTPSPSTETLATRRNAPLLRLSSSSHCAPQTETDQQVRAPSPKLVQQDLPLDSAVAVSATASSSSSAASISDKRLQHEMVEPVPLDDVITNLPSSPSTASIASTCSSSSRMLKRSKRCDQLSKHYSPIETTGSPSASNASVASPFESLPALSLPTLAPLTEPEASTGAPPLNADAAGADVGPSPPTGPPAPRSPPRLTIPPPPVPPPPTHSPTPTCFSAAPRRRSVPARQEMRASYAASSIYQLQAFLDSISEPPMGELPPMDVGEPLQLEGVGVQAVHGPAQGPAVVVVPETKDELDELNRKIDQVADEVVELERVLMTVAEEESEIDEMVVKEEDFGVDGQANSGSTNGSAVGRQRLSTLSAGGEEGAQLSKKQSLNEVIAGKKRLLRQMSQVSLQAQTRLGRPYEDPVPTIRSLSSTLGASCPYPGIDESRWLAYVHQRDVVQGKKQFNVSAAHGIRYLVNRAILPNPDAPVPPTQRLHHQLQCAHAIATFLINEHGVSMTSVGRLLGQSHEFSRMVLKEYVAKLHMGPGVPLDHAVRAFLARVRLPGDQDAMDRIADEVARGWWEQNAMSTRVLPVRAQSPLMPGGGSVPPGGQYGQHQHQQHHHSSTPPPRSRSPLHSITAALASLRNRAGSGASTLSTMTHHSVGRGGHHEPITLGLSHWWWTLPVAVALTGALFKLHVEVIAGMIKRGNRQQRKAFVTIVAKDLDRAVPGLAEDQGLASALKAVYDDAVSIPGAVSGDNEFFALYMYFQEMERALQVEYESMFASSLGEGEQAPPMSPMSPLLATSPTSPVWSQHPYSSGSGPGSGHTSVSPMHSLPRGSTSEPLMLMRCMPSFTSAASTQSRNSTSSARVIRGPSRHTSLDPPMSVASMSVTGAGSGPKGHPSSFIPMSAAYASSDLSLADSTSKRSALGRSKDSMLSAWKKMKRKLSTGQQQHQNDFMHQEYQRPSHLATTHGRPVTRFPPTEEE